MAACHTPHEHAPVTCREKIEAELAALGVPASTVDGILAAVSLRSVDDMAALLGADSEAVQDLQRLFDLAEGYGYKVGEGGGGGCLQQGRQGRRLDGCVRSAS